MLVWLEYRANRGHIVACKLDGKQAPQELTEMHDVRARIGYGGGALGAARDAVLLIERSGCLLHHVLQTGQTRRLTQGDGFVASPAMSPNGKFVAFVHHNGNTDRIAAVRMDDAELPCTLVEGADFYMQPAWHPDGAYLAWIEWDHPHMPWDATRLCYAHPVFENGKLRLEKIECVGRGAPYSITEPRFSRDGRYLAFISDQSGGGSIYMLDLSSGCVRQLVQPAMANAQHADGVFGAPAWLHGTHTYDFSADGKSVVAITNDRGFCSLLRIDIESGNRSPCFGFDTYADLRQVEVSTDDTIAVIASASDISPRIVVRRKEDTTTRVLRRTTAEQITEIAGSPQPVQWCASDGTYVHALLYEPTAEAAISGEGTPPAIVAIHGGPTAQATAGYNPNALFFATRGYVYIDVNYRGSTGYGRSYQQALNGNWGIYDVEDALGARQYLIGERIADAGRIAIMGGSAGGLTVLKALCDHAGLFAAGVCLYGVSDLFALAKQTHKFEAHYLDTLIGPLPEATSLYQKRSPLFSADRITDPIAIFQGALDRVVPPQQSDAIVSSLRRRNVVCEYHLYEDEEHGFRKPQTLKLFYTDVERFLRTYVVGRPCVTPKQR